MASKYRFWMLVLVACIVGLHRVGQSNMVQWKRQQMHEGDDSSLMWVTTFMMAGPLKILGRTSWVAHVKNTGLGWQRWVAQLPFFLKNKVNHIDGVFGSSIYNFVVVVVVVVVWFLYLAYNNMVMVATNVTSCIVCIGTSSPYNALLAKPSDTTNLRLLDTPHPPTQRPQKKKNVCNSRKKTRKMKI